MRIGLQLYTIRRECERDLPSSLEAVARLGYEGVELNDLHGHEPATVRLWLEELGLSVAGRHAGLEALETRLPELAAELALLGSDRIALGWIEPPSTAQDAQAMVDRITRVAVQARRYKLRFGFHNHAGELRRLEDEGTFLDLLRELPADLLWLELDLGWAWEAEVDPVEVLERTSGRCPLVHVKDFRSRGGETYCPVGDGAVGYERVLPAALQAGVEWLLVEQDEVDGPPFEAVERSMSAVRRMLAGVA